MRGGFITLEGGEGAGKSTLIAGLKAELAARGLEIVVTREPGGTPNAESLRDMLLCGETDRWSPIAEALLMYAARVDHVERLIAPALERGAYVLCDRFADSTLAYQGAAGGVDLSRIRALHAAVLGEFAPDATLILDISPEAGLARTVSRGEDPTRFEKLGMEFHQKLRQGFLDIAAGEPDRCAVIPAEQSQSDVLAAAMTELEARMPGLARIAAG